ncbi:DNA recombination protein RmuC, partial [Silanimonas lenta]|uniref:DNA recombination protein RmuC n=1 Tax=Silanimonas lenta TaxID=265429 RepID=UPI002FDF4D85
MEWAWGIVGLLLGLLAAGVLAWRARAGAREWAELGSRFEAGIGRVEQRLEALAGRVAGLAESSERAERGLREEQRASRAELTDSLGRRLDGFEQRLGARFDGFEQRLGQALERLDRSFDALTQSLGQEGARQREATDQALARFTQDQQQRMAEVRQTLERRLAELQQGNEAKLEQMRATVDEKLHATLETRLGESFRLVSERLEQVHAGLGEMRSLAHGVGDLKRVLGNVKSRGVFGEVQLAAILDELLTPEQYAANVAVRPDSAERVEFAVKLPGDGGGPVWLPIDAKFPREDYERLLEAQERADAEAAAAAGQALEQRLRLEAKKIAEKYVAPPHSTDFAVLFLPTEGLYAEVLRRPGLFEALQREYRVTLTGPTTLAALLNSLRMGFRTLAIQQRSSDVWKILGAVRTEFGKFGDVLAKTRKKLDEAANVIDNAGVR